MAQNVIGLLFGVEGGGRIDSGSGRLIVEDLTSIVNKINAGNSPVPKIKLDFDLSASVKNLQDQFKAAIAGAEFSDLSKSVGNISVQLNGIASGMEKVQAALNAVVGALPKGESALAKMAAAGSAGIGDMLDKLMEVRELVESINGKSFNTTNVYEYKGGNKTNAEELELYRTKAEETLKLVLALQSSVADFGNVNSRALAQATSAIGGFARFWDLSENFKGEGKYWGDISSASTVSSIQKVIGTLDAYRNAYTSIIENSDGQAIMPDTSGLDAATAKIEEYTAHLKEMEQQFLDAATAAGGGSASNQSDSGTPLPIADSTAGIKASLDEVASMLDGTRQKILDTFNLSDIRPDVSGIISELDKISSALKNVELQGKEAAKKEASGKKKSRSSDKEDKPSYLDNYTAALKRYYKAYTAIEKYMSKSQSLIEVDKDGTFSSKISRYNSLAKEVNEARRAFDELQNSERQAAEDQEQVKEANARGAAALRKHKITLEEYGASSEQVWSKNSAKVYDYIRTVEGAASRDTKARRELEELARYASGANGKDVNVLLEKLAKVREYIDRNSLATETWNQKMQKTFGGKIRTLLAGAVSAKIAQYLRTIYINVRDLNTELTQLRIVTDANQKSLDKFTKTATSAAKRIGASVTDLTKSATVFARLGYSLEESEKFAELTAAYSKVADTDVSSASSAITSIVKAFGVNSNELEGLLDKLMWVGQTFPISADEIGEGMKEAGSALQASGNTLVQSIALLTAANTTVQDVNKAATAMRTITARMQSSTTDLENLGESIDDLMSTADLDRYMRAFGIAVTDATGELRATYDVLNDLSKIWNDLSTTDKASIAEKLSGNRQQNIFLSLMNSFDSARQVVSDIDKSTGLLADATEMRVDSIQGKVDQLKATLEEMSQKLLNSTLVKTAVTVAGGLVTVLEKITDLLGGIPGLAFIAFSAFGGSARNSAMNGLKDFAQTLEVIFGKKYVLDIPFGKEFNESVEKERNLFNAMVDDFQSEGGTLASAIDKNLKDAGKAVKEYVKMNEDAILATKGNAEETKKLFDKHIKETLATDAFAESVKTFKGSVNAIRLYNNGIDGAGIEQDQFNRAVAEGNPQLKAYLDSVEQGKASVWGYTKAAYSAQIATLALTAGVTAAQLGLRFIKWYTDDSTEALRNFASAALALGAVITLTILAIKKQWAVFKGSNLIGWIVLAIELVVNGIIQIGKGIKNIVNSTTNAKNTAVEAAQAARDALGEVQDKLEKVNDKLKTAKDRYEELQKKAKSGSLTLSERNELKELDRRIALLEAEAAAANAEERVKNKTSQVAAADAIRKTLDESVSSAKLNEKDRWWRWLYSFVANDKEILQESANKKNASKWVDDILENWENATDKEKEFISNYKKALDEQKDSLTYYSGSNLEQWQEDVNAAYDDYWRFIQKFLIADGQFEQAWNSIVSMERFDGIDRLFQSIAGDDLSESALRTLYTTNAQFKDFVNYLESVGIFAWDDATKVGTLANSIRSFAKQVSAVESKSPLAVLEAIEDRYDRLFKAMSDMREYGALTADTLSEILQDTELAKYLSQTANGFELSSDAMERWIETLIAAYSAESALSNLKEDNKTTILSNLKNLRAVLATLTVISKEDSYEKEKDDLNDRLDKFKELIDMRKKLLETYQEELDYQKELAKKQESVASLQTKLAIAQLDDSAAGRARVRELEQKLKEAQEELDDYTLEHAIQEIESELDEQYGEYEKFIKDKLDAIEAAINGVGSGFELDQGMFQNMLSKIDALITEISEKPTPDNSGYVMDYADWAEYWHKQHPDIADPAPPRPTSAEFKAAQDYVTSRGMREGDKARWGQDKNFLELLRAYEATGGSIKDIIGVYHSGGLVGDVSTLESSEEYAKLLKGEFVSTPAMMSRFMKQTLPAMLSFGTRGAEFNAPLVEIQCDNVTTEALPGLRKIVDDAVSEIKRQFDSGFSRTGYRKSVRQI